MVGSVPFSHQRSGRWGARSGGESDLHHAVADVHKRDSAAGEVGRRKTWGEGRVCYVQEEDERADSVPAGVVRKIARDGEEDVVAGLRVVQPRARGRGGRRAWERSGNGDY